MQSEADELLRHAIGGDEKALSALLRRYEPDVRRALADGIPKRFRSLLAEDDVVQQTFTDAFLGIQDFTAAGPDSFLAWLKTVARNNLREALRALETDKRGGGRRRVAGAPTDASWTLFDLLRDPTRTTPSRHAARGEIDEALRRAIRRLPRAYRRVVELYDLEGRSADEVAAELGRSPGAVYLLRNRAHQRLRELLGATTKFFSDSP